MKKIQSDHRVRVTKLMLRKAFTELLSKKPLQSISVKELCELANVNRGTFYTHYQDIYALLEEIEGEMYASFQKALEPLLSHGDGSPVAICMGIFECLRENYDMCIIMLGDYSDKQFMAKLLNLGREKCLETYAHHFKNATQRRSPIRPSKSCPAASAIWKTRKNKYKTKRVLRIFRGAFFAGK